MTNHPSVELLAPAGCYASLQGAVNSGADAVYFGLAQLNMRARSRRSFHLSDLPTIMDRCRLGGVNGYLTLNTLLYDHDLRLTDNLLQAAVENGVNAVIAADMACVLRARELGLEVHLSTQLSVSNYPALAFYAQFCDRIVLARELNLSVIAKIFEQIRQNDLRGPSGRPVEIEAFAHGALCIAVSGRCGMSLFTDNASANRGACVQNCRKEYTVKDKETGKELVVDNNFVMSPNDISTISFLDEVLRAGVHTLKIEGRGRSPEYVALVTRAYRRAIEAVADGSYSRELVDDLLADLQKVYNRGLSDGYYLGRPQGWSAAYGSKATQQKVLRGKVVNYFAKIGVAEVVASGALERGGDFLIIGPSTGVVEGKLKEMRLDAGATEAVSAGDIFSFKVSSPVRRNDQFFILEPTTAKAAQA